MDRNEVEILAFRDDDVGFQNSKYKAKVKLVEDFALSNLDTSVSDFVWGSYEEPKSGLFIRILFDELSEADVEHLGEKLGKLSHLRDRRTPEEYACDLIVGWLLEDMVEAILKSGGLDVALSSADKGREFLSRPKASPDMSVRMSCGHTRKLELVKDFTGFWKKNKKGHLRDNKFRNLLDENGVLLGIDMANGAFFARDAASLPFKRLESHYFYGGKPAYEIDTRTLVYFPLQEMGSELLRVFEREKCLMCGGGG